VCKPPYTPVAVGLTALGAFCPRDKSLGQKIWLPRAVKFPLQQLVCNVLFFIFWGRKSPRRPENKDRVLPTKSALDTLKNLSRADTPVTLPVTLPVTPPRTQPTKQQTMPPKKKSKKQTQEPVREEATTTAHAHEDVDSDDGVAFIRERYAELPRPQAAEAAQAEAHNSDASHSSV